MAPMPAFNTLSQYIQAAASGNRDSLFHLFMAVFALVRATMSLLIRHYQAHPRALTPNILARIQFCAVRLKAIYYTLHHAPERFLSPAQLRALTRARAVLAHICHQPVDFTPLAPLLAPLAGCPPSLPRSVKPISTPHPTPESAVSTPASPGASLDTPRSALRTSSEANPLLLRSPGCALASVLLQLAAIYRVPASPALAPPSNPSTTTTPPPPEAHSTISFSTPAADLSPRSALVAPHSPHPPP